MINKLQLPKETVDKIIDYYCNYQYGQQKTAKLCGVTITQVRKTLLENNIRIRNFSEAATISNQIRRKYSVNDNYFDEENPNMAYYLGFIAADGTVSKDGNQIKIGLSSVDKNFLERMREELSIEKEIFTYETANGFSVSELRFTSAKIKQKLAEYNIVPRKTYSFSFPTKLNRKYWIDFIRGYFDGDGSISTAGPHAIRFQICAHRKEVLETIINFFYEEYSIPKVNIQIAQREKNNLYYFQYSTSSTKEIYNKLYYPNCICLPRKYEKYTALI